MAKATRVVIFVLFCLFVYVNAQFQFRFQTGGQQQAQQESEDAKIEKAREMANV
jgi:hypothetical protein